MVSRDNEMNGEGRSDTGNLGEKGNGAAEGDVGVGIWKVGV